MRNKAKLDAFFFVIYQKRIGRSVSLRTTWMSGKVMTIWARETARNRAEFFNGTLNKALRILKKYDKSWEIFQAGKAEDEASFLEQSKKLGIEQKAAQTISEFHKQHA